MNIIQMMASTSESVGPIADIRLQLICLGGYDSSPVFQYIDITDLSLGSLRATKAIAWTSIFPYVYFMIGSFNEVPDAQISFYAGLLIAIFTFSEFLSGMIWSSVYC